VTKYDHAQCAGSLHAPYAEEQVTGTLGDLNQAKGGVLTGSLLLVGDAARVDAGGLRTGAIRVFDVSRPQAPRAFPDLDAILNGPPTALTLLRDYTFWAKAPGEERLPEPREIRRGDLLAVAGGLVGSGFKGDFLETQPKFLRLFELVHSDNPDAPVELRVLATADPFRRFDRHQDDLATAEPGRS
jgi:hypothetical protein